MVLNARKSLAGRAGRALFAAACVCACLSANASAQVLRPFTQRNPTTNVRGNIALVGNVLVTCRQQGNQSACPNARAGSTANNSDFTTEFVDADTDSSTVNSSSATLTLPAGSTVLWAGLYWGARSTAAARSQIRFKPANSGIYTTLNAATLDSTMAAPNAYQGFVEVTTHVRSGGNGAYWAAGVAADNGQDGTGFFAGWSLVVVYQNDAQPLRNLTVFDGFASVSNGNNVTTTVTGLQTPFAGAFTAFVGSVTYEGDLGITGDSFQITNTATNLTTTISDALNPANNYTNSSITSTGTRLSAKSPDYVNQLGFDVDTVSVANASTVLGNNATSARLTFNSTGDLYFPGVLTFAVDVHRPQIGGNFTKGVTDLNGGQTLPGDVLEYTLNITNTGTDTALLLQLTDAIPAGTTFVPGSLQVTAGANVGTKSDAGGDDQAEYDAAQNRVVFRLGAGANAVSGGTLASNETTAARFRVQVNATAADGSVIPNQATLTYRGATLGADYTDLSDGDSAASGDQTTNVTVFAPPNVSLVKSVSPAGDVLPGTDIIYTITFANAAGARAASSLVIADKIPADTEFKLGSVAYAPGTSGLAAPAVEYSIQARGPADDPPNPWIVYAPGGAPGTYDAQITYVRFRFATGALAANTSGQISFTVRVR